MSSPKHDRDSDRESLTGWTLVDREGKEGNPEKTIRRRGKKEDDKDSGESSSSPVEVDVKKKEEENKEKNESGCGTEEEEGEEELSEDLISMGKRVQEIKGESVKASSGSDSSDIETLDCPGPDDFYEDHTQGYSSLHSSLLSSSLSGFTFVEDADDGDVESLGSSDVLVLDQEGKAVDEETDLSLASSPSLPEDLPAIKPDTQYRHTPDRDLNSRLNIVVALTLACVLGLGLGHFLGWSSRSMWQENLNSAQVRRLRELQDDLLSCINTPSHELPLEEPESREPEYLPTTSFIPVLPEVEAEGAANVETFVESLVVPLEEAGVVINPGQQQRQQGDIHHTPYRPGSSMEPTFATLDLLYGSSDPAPGMDQEQGPSMHSGLLEPPLTSHTVAEDEIDPSQPQPPLPLKTMEPTLSEEGTSPPTVSQTNTLPPVELDSGLESFLGEESEKPLLQSSAVPGQEEEEEEEVSAAAIEYSQIIEALNLENEGLRSEISRLQQENVSPIKISGKDGKIARDMRERITQLLIDNEELRVAVAKQQFDSLPEGDTKAFSNALGTNYKLRLAVSKLIHLVPDLTSLKVSANDLQKENDELQKQVGRLRYQEQPLPQELNAMTREVENLKKVVDEASKKKKAPPNFENAKIYLSYMSQVLQSLQDFKEGGFMEKLDVATDVFEELVPGNVKPSASVHQKLNSVRSKFNNLRSSLASKWDKIKDLGRPQNLARVSQETLAKMNRVIVNVVNKMKDIGQVSIMKRGKASFDSTTAALAQSFAALGDQFEKTWNNLEAEVDSDEEDNGDELLAVEVRAGTGEEEEDEGIVDDMEEAEEREPQDIGKEPSDIKNLGPNKAKEGGKSGEAGNGEGGRGGSGGRGGGAGAGGGDDKKDVDDKKSNKESVEKKEKPDGKRDRSRNRISSKEEKKEEQKEKKAKKKEEKAKKKKEKEDKKSKKDKNNNKKTKEEKENYSHKKEDWGKKNLQEDDKRHQRKQFNKFDKKQHRHGSDDDDNDDDDDDEETDDGKLKRKYQKKKPTHEDDNNDSDDKSKRKSHKNEVLEEDDDDDDKKKGLLRHWEKPSRKNYRREFPGPKKAFIRRRGKNATRYHGNEDRDWMQKRATGREVRRREEQKADWLFERAKHRSHKRVEEQKADWQFDRASHRREQRVGEPEEYSHRAPAGHEKFSHTKHERRQAKRRYVRFDYDDDDYDDDDDDDDDDEIDNDDYHLHHHSHHHHQHHHHQERGRGEHKHHNKKGKREWVIPNFSATGKTYYY